MAPRSGLAIQLAIYASEYSQRPVRTISTTAPNQPSYHHATIRTEPFNPRTKRQEDSTPCIRGREARKQGPTVTHPTSVDSRDIHFHKSRTYMTRLDGPTRSAPLGYTIAGVTQLFCSLVAAIDNLDPVHKTCSVMRPTRASIQRCKRVVQGSRWN